jgi:electron transfer flavoprotein alpha subunit
MRKRTAVGEIDAGLARREPSAIMRIGDASPTVAACSDSQDSEWVLVVPDIEDSSVSPRDSELVGAARLVAGELGARLLVLTFDEATRIDWRAFGVDAVVRVQRTTSGAYEPERDALLVAAVMERWCPRHCLFPDTMFGMGEVGRRVVALKDLDCIARAIEIGNGGARALARGTSHEFTAELPSVIFVESGVRCASAHKDVRASAEYQPPQIAEVTPNLMVQATRRTDVTTLPLADAHFIVAAGNGISDWQTFLRVANALNATIGGTRVVCDRGALPKSRQVGTSGAMVSAGCYVAFGISGAPEHLAGITSCSNVVAVNTDANAPLLRRADLAVVADANAVLRSMLQLVERPEMVGAA